MRWILALVVVAAVFALTYFRFAPHDQQAINQISPPHAVGDVEAENGFHAIRAFTVSEPDILKAVDLAIMQTPRTQLLANDEGAGGVRTYVTRSAVFGFPDYTTVWIDTAIDGSGPHLNIRSRARFGKSDLGVNKARIEGWLDQLGPLIVAP